jgi:hypothetical protein
MGCAMTDLRSDRCPEVADLATGLAAAARQLDKLALQSPHLPGPAIRPPSLLSAMPPAIQGSDEC